MVIPNLLEMKHPTKTEVSKYIRLLKYSNKTATIKLRMLRQVSAKPKYNYCELSPKRNVIYYHFF